MALNEKPFRVLLDLTELNLKAFKYVWTSISPSESRTIGEFKSNILTRFGIVENVQFFLREGSLLEDEKIFILREDDVVQIKYENTSSSQHNVSTFGSEHATSETCAILSQPKRCKRKREPTPCSNEVEDVTPKKHAKKKKKHEKVLEKHGKDSPKKTSPALATKLMKSCKNGIENLYSKFEKKSHRLKHKCIYSKASDSTNNSSLIKLIQNDDEDGSKSYMCNPMYAQVSKMFPECEVTDFASENSSRSSLQVIDPGTINANELYPSPQTSFIDRFTRDSLSNEITTSTPREHKDESSKNQLKEHKNESDNMSGKNVEDRVNMGVLNVTYSSSLSPNNSVVADSFQDSGTCAAEKQGNHCRKKRRKRNRKRKVSLLIPPEVICVVSDEEKSVIGDLTDHKIEVPTLNGGNTSQRKHHIFHSPTRASISSFDRGNCDVKSVNKEKQNDLSIDVPSSSVFSPEMQAKIDAGEILMPTSGALLQGRLPRKAKQHHFDSQTRTVSTAPDKKQDNCDTKFSEARSKQNDYGKGGAAVTLSSKADFRLFPVIYPPQKYDLKSEDIFSLNQSPKTSENGFGNEKATLGVSTSIEKTQVSTEGLISTPKVSTPQKIHFGNQNAYEPDIHDKAEKNGKPKTKYELLPLLKCLPAEGSHIAFKMLELDESYSPEISEYKEGIIKKIGNRTEELEIELCQQEYKPGRTGKFENLYGDPDEIPAGQLIKTVNLRWLALIEPRMIK